MNSSLILGSRASALALCQTEQVRDWLLTVHSGLVVTIKTYTTQGDMNLGTPLHLIGDKGLFIKELETALLAGEVHAAIHSAKDLPSQTPDGLHVQAVGPREDPRDVLISRSGLSFRQLPVGAVVGTSSLRRTAMLQQLRDDLVYIPIRGNLQTRLGKLEAGQCDALVLAAAGVHRLGWHSKITQYFDPLTELLPSVGQGILAMEYCQDWVSDFFEPLRQVPVEIAWQAERAFLHAMEGGCQVPMGGYAYQTGDVDTAPWQLTGVYYNENNQAHRASLPLDRQSPATTGLNLAKLIKTIKQPSL